MSILRAALYPESCRRSSNNFRGVRDRHEFAASSDGTDICFPPRKSRPPIFFSSLYICVLEMLESLMLTSECYLLALPPELRQLIFSNLFRPFDVIQITARPPSIPVEDEEGATSWPADQESFAVARHNLHPQLLATCKQLHIEGLPFLYSHRHFDFTARESLKLLLYNVGPKTFSNIHHIVLDWDSLQDFAWSMSKPDYAIALSGLHVIEMATWRNRHVDTTGTRWRNVRGYERMMCQAATDILHKHASLKLLVEEQFVRKGSITHTLPTEHNSHDKDQVRRLSVDTGPRRVKWRFLASEVGQKDNEIAIDIESDLKTLKATQDEASDGGFHLPMIDPF